MRYLGYSDYYSVITKFRHEKGKRLYQLREYMQGDDFGLLTAISDGSRNPDMSRLDWQEIECMSPEVETSMIGTYRGKCPKYGDTNFTLFVEK